MLNITQPSDVTGGGSAKKQFTIWSSSAGYNGTVYTVPAGKTFTGYVYPANPTYSLNWRFNVNGTTMDLNATATYGTWEPIPIYLGAGDVISNYSTYYFGLTGYEE